MKKILFLLLFIVPFFAVAQNKNEAIVAAFRVNGQPNYGGMLMLPEVLSINEIFLMKKSVSANLIYFEVTIIVTKEGKYPLMYPNYGPIFNDNVKKLFANASAEDTIYIDNITVKTEVEADVKKVNSLMIKVL